MTSTEEPPDHHHHPIRAGWDRDGGIWLVGMVVAITAGICLILRSL